MERDRIVLSIRPQYARAILAGEKTYELRRVRPHVGAGTLVYIYATSPEKAIIGEFVCGDICEAPILSLWRKFGKPGRIDREAFQDYFDGVETGYAIEIKGPTRWKIPLGLESIRGVLGSFQPPQYYRRIHPEERFGELLPSRAQIGTPP